MASNDKQYAGVVEKIWYAYLTTGRVPPSVGEPWYLSRSMSAVYRRLPASPRCRLCQLPFHGVGGAVMKHLFGIVPSRLNPQMCNLCEQFAEEHHGGAEVELTMLFADVRGSTSMAETMAPAEFSRLIDRFYTATTRVLFKANAMVEKFVGDAVTGFFTPGQCGADHARAAVQAARDILRATGHGSPGGPWIPVGVGLHTGVAYVGAVNHGTGVTDIAVLGDTPNIGARLAALAGAGEIHASRATAQAAGLDAAGAKIHHPVLKGRNEPTEVWVLAE